MKRVVMRIGFIGTGAMVSAIARGAVSGGLNGSVLVFTDRDHHRARTLADELGATTASSNAELAAQVDYLVLGVKPHVQSAVIAEIADVVRERPDLCIISIAAGRSTQQIRDDFGFGVAIVRVMPNVNAQIGQSMSALCASGASEEQFEQARALMEYVGRTTVLAESDFPAFMALASCSPAWIAAMIDALATAGVKHGLPKDQATAIVAQAFYGSAALVLQAQERGMVPAQIVDQVSSPGGTTIAGLVAAQDAGLQAALVRAVDAAVARDHHLG